MKKYKFYCLAVFFFYFACLCSSSFAVNRSADYYCSAAIKYQKLKRYDLAKKYFDIGISKNPNSIKLYYFRGKLNQHYLGDYKSAIVDYSKVIKMNPRYNPKAFWRRGLCLYELGMYSNSIYDYTNCLKYMNKYGRVYFLRAKSYAKMKNFVKAKHDLDMAVSCDRKYRSAASELYNKMILGQDGY